MGLDLLLQVLKTLFELSKLDPLHYCLNHAFDFLIHVLLDMHRQSLYFFVHYFEVLDELSSFLRKPDLFLARWRLIMIQIVQNSSPLMHMNMIVLPFALKRNQCRSEEVSSFAVAHWHCFALPPD